MGSVPAWRRQITQDSKTCTKQTYEAAYSVREVRWRQTRFLPTPPARPLDPQQPQPLRAERLAAGLDCITLWRTTRESSRIPALPPHWLPQLRRLSRLGKAAISFEAKLQEQCTSPFLLYQSSHKSLHCSVPVLRIDTEPRGRHWRRGRDSQRLCSNLYNSPIRGQLVGTRAS